MSTDIIVIKTRRILASLLEWSDDDVSDGLGTPEEIRDQCNRAFPGTAWYAETEGNYLEHKEYGVEISISKGPPSSLHLTLRTWNDQRPAEFYAQMEVLCSSAGWQAFVLSDNSAFFPPTKP